MLTFIGSAEIFRAQQPEHRPGRNGSHVTAPKDITGSFRWKLF
jgi:hypothetical protein